MISEPLHVGDTVDAYHVLAQRWSVQPCTIVAVVNGVYYLDGGQPPRTREDVRLHVREA
jgi:hypothetical protein